AGIADRELKIVHELHGGCCRSTLNHDAAHQRRLSRRDDVEQLKSDIALAVSPAGDQDIAGPLERLRHAPRVIEAPEKPLLPAPRQPDRGHTLANILGEIQARIKE